MLLTKAVTYIIVFEELRFYRPKRTEKEKKRQEKESSHTPHIKNSILHFLV